MTKKVIRTPRLGLGATAHLASPTPGADGQRDTPIHADMQAKAQPLQERSRATYEAILAAAATLLEEVGIDSLSTNMICARANLTPPALYRYFPNKYALLRELGIRLMQVQDQVGVRLDRRGGLEPQPRWKRPSSGISPIQKRVVEVTRAQPASLWIARAMRAVPMLREVRTQSRDKVVEAAVPARCGPIITETSDEHACAWRAAEHRAVRRPPSR